MTNNLEKVEQALNELRKSLYTHDNSYQYIPNYYPFSGVSQTFEKNTRDLLDVSYSLLYQVKEQQSEIKKLKEDLAKKELTDDDQVVIWVDNKYYLFINILTTNISFALEVPRHNTIESYTYECVKFILHGSSPSLHLLDGHKVDLIPVKDFNQKFNTSYEFVGLDLNED